MLFRIDGNFIDVRPNALYGGRYERGTFEYLYRLPDGRWFLHSLNMVTLTESAFREIPEGEAIDWLIGLRRADELSGADRSRSNRVAPDWVIPREESFQYEKLQYAGPPPIGQHDAIMLPRVSRAWDSIMQRQSQFLEPGSVLENVMWPPMADTALTAGFRQERHDPLVTHLQTILETRLLEQPRLSNLQSLQDCGCDLLIEWPHRAKYGVQLKSNGDVEQGDFATKTVAQIQDSRQHALRRLYVVLAADANSNSNAQKLRGFESRVSVMNDPYVRVIQPERAWNLLRQGS